MRRDQINLDSEMFNQANLRRDLIKLLLRSDIANVETSLDDDKLAIMVSLKKAVLSEESLAAIKRDVVRFINTKFVGIMDYRSVGVALDNNRLVVICLFELIE